MNTPHTHLSKPEIILALRKLRSEIEAETEPFTTAQECLMVDVCAALGVDIPAMAYVMGLENPTRSSLVLGEGLSR